MSKKSSKQFTDGDIVIQERPVPPVPSDSEEVHVENNFVIEEKDVPKRSGRKSTLNYPIDKLTSGSKESFLVPVTNNREKNVFSSIRTFAFRNKYKVILRVEENGVRVWRKAEKVAA